jgi:ubiquinone/menaquinone biosynthesis C-methylase UbiE
MADAPAGVAALFDRVADTYDTVGVEWFGPIGRGLVAELGPTAGERALDIGCGRGAVLFRWRWRSERRDGYSGSTSHHGWSS